MALPFNDITTDLVAQTLGVNSHDVATLCTSANINMWSKYKPVRLNSNSTIGDVNWFKAGGNCGFDIPVQKYAQESGIRGWTYLKPNDYYRLDDFAGYEHTGSNPPIMLKENEDIVFDFATDQVLNFHLDINFNNGTDSPGRWLTIPDLSSSSIAGLYPAVAIAGSDKNGNTQGPFLFSSDKSVWKHSALDNRMYITIEGEPLEKLKAFMFSFDCNVYYTFVAMGNLMGNRWDETSAQKFLPPAPIQPNSLRINSGKYYITTQYYYLGRRTEIDDMDITPIQLGDDSVNKMAGFCTFWLNDVTNYGLTGYFNPSELEVEYINILGEIIRHRCSLFIYRNGFTQELNDGEVLLEGGTGTHEFNIKLDMGATYDGPPPVIDSYIKFFWIAPGGTEVEAGSTGWIKIQDTRSYM